MHNRHVRIYTSLILIFSVATLSASYFVSRLKAKVITDHTHNLETVTAAIGQSVETWAERERSTSTQFGRDPVVVRLCEALLAEDRTPEALLASDAQREIRQYLAPHLESERYLGFFLVAPDGTSLASTRDANTGTPNLLLHQPGTLERIWLGDTIISPPQGSDVPLPSPTGELAAEVPTMFVGAPVRNGGGEIIAALTFRLSPATHLSPLFALGAAWERGMTYAFDGNGRVISEPRSRETWERNGIVAPGAYASLAVGLLDPKNPYRPVPAGTPVPSRTANSGTNSDGYRGYDGRRMYSAWQWIPDLRMGVQTDIAEDTVLEPVYFVERASLLVIGVTVALVLVLLLLYERARSRGERERRKLEITVSTMINGLISTDREGTILSTNRAVVSMTGYSEDELAGRLIGEMFVEHWEVDEEPGYGEPPPDHAGRLRGDRRRMTLRPKTGDLVPVDVSVGQADRQSGENHSYTIVLSDAREQVRAEEMDRARAVAEEANQAKSKFLSSMSHEIRTPLNVVLGFTQILERDETLSDRQRNAVEAISHSGTHLLELLNDVLEMAKIEAGQIVIDEEVFRPQNKLNIFKEMFQLRAEAKRIHFDVQPVGELPDALLADCQKIRQIVINLLSNAFKFTETGGVVLRAGVERMEGDTAWLRFEVEDTGPGISANDMNHVFAAFEQTLDGRRTQGGTGLGLAISKQLAEAMGGSLTVTSTLGKGSTFVFSFPAHLASEDDVTPEAPVVRKKVVGLAPGQENVGILIVDDVVSNRKVLVSFFSLLGIACQEAEDGAEAVKIFEASRPQIILMDVAMPVLNGYEATARIRALPGGQDVIIIILSASSFKNEEESALKHGANGFLRKPYKLEELLKSLTTYAGVRWSYALDGAEAAPTNGQCTDGALLTLNSLSDSVKAKLAAAAQRCQQKEIREIAASLPAEDAEIAEILVTWATQYRYDRIVATIGHDVKEPLQC